MARRRTLTWGTKPDYTGFNFSNLPQFVAAQNVKKAAVASSGFRPAASAPPPPPPLNTGALPIDLQVGVDNARQSAQSIYANTSGQINQAQDRAASDYGFSPTYAVNGDARSVTGLTVDPSNPYSRAAALQRSYDQSKAGATNSMAARGQLYSGSLQNAQNENTRRFGEGDNSLRQGFLDFIARTEGQRKDASVTNQNAGSSALADAIAAAAGRTPADVTPTPADVPVAAAPPKPSGSQWASAKLQASGPRAGLWYREVKGANGVVKVYSNGARIGA